ncbi:MAG: glyoxylase family protein, partial [Subtercola sp.]|nr:glyoxylase family protein [Subtercola sp.]
MPVPAEGRKGMSVHSAGWQSRSNEDGAQPALRDHPEPRVSAWRLTAHRHTRHTEGAPPVPVAAIDFAHLRLTVTDIDRSRAFYDAVFGFDVLVEAPAADADDATKEKLAFVFGGVIYQFAGGVLGLRPVAPADDVYDEDRVGLDHLSFAVPARSDLDDAVALLDEL